MRRYALYLTLLLASIAPLMAASDREEALKQLRKFNEFYNYLYNGYFEAVDTKPLVEQAIREVLSELDPHSSYLNSDQVKSEMENMEGEFSGIGIEFNVSKDTIRVVNTILSAPAEAVGMRAGDRIIAIDGASAIGLQQSDVPKLLRGPRGTRVSVEALRLGVSEPLHFDITRDNIPLTTIEASYMLTPEVAYIKIGRFGMQTMKEMREALDALPQYTSLVLDLQGNGGGIMNEAVDMAEYMLHKGSHILAVEGSAVGRTEFKAQREGSFTDGNLYVLIDEYSASASEIVSGAIQDWDRGVVIGRGSFGKGLVQRQFELSDGSAIRLTIARYLTPTGRAIQRPFAMGHSEEYFAHKEDSTAVRTAYKTLRTARTVYDGNGIEPDITIERDSTKLSLYYAELIRSGTLHEFVGEQIARSRSSILRRMPTFEEYDEKFSVNKKMAEELIELATSRGVKSEAPEVEDLIEESALDIKGLMARTLYSSSALYQILNRRDTAIFNTIIRLESSPEEYKSILGGSKY